MKFSGIPLAQASRIGIEICNQLEILHQLGYTHGDIKLQNICYNQEKDSYHLIDLASAQKIFHKSGEHKDQVNHKSFF
jgi:serine/threonine protein kinase